MKALALLYTGPLSLIGLPRVGLMQRGVPYRLLDGEWVPEPKLPRITKAQAEAIIEGHCPPAQIFKRDENEEIMHDEHGLPLMQSAGDGPFHLVEIMKEG